MTAIRESARSLRRTPFFTAVAILSLGGGIALLTSVLAVISATLAPRPYAEPARLVEVMSTVSAEDHRLADFLDFERLRDWVGRDYRTLGRFAGAGETSLVLRTENGGAEAHSLVVLGEYFRVLGVDAAIGRTLTAADDDPSAEPAVVVSDRVWRDLLGGDRSALGRVIQLSGTDYTVVGVLPPSVSSGRVFWVPAAHAAPEGRPGAWQGIGRLQADASIAAAAEEMQRLAAGELARNPGAHGGQGASAFPLGARTQGWDPMTKLVTGMAVAVFLLSLANLTNLFLVRAARRSTALAVRASLGASRWQLGRAVATEGLLVGAGGTLLGVLLAVWGKDLVNAIARSDTLLSAAPVLDLRVLLLASAVGAFASVVLAVEPLRRLGGLQLRELLQRGSSMVTLSRADRRSRDSLVVVQVAVSFILVAMGASLFTALAHFRSLDLGYDVEGVAQVAFDWRLTDLDPLAQRELAETIVERAGRHPEILGAAAVRPVSIGWPPRPEFYGVPEGVPGYQPGMDNWFVTLSGYDAVTEDYFETLGIRIVRGRRFGPQDRPGSEPVAIVSESTAQGWWVGEDPIGRRLRIGDEWITIVGVSDDALGLQALDRMAYAPNQFGRTRRMRVRVYRPMAQTDSYPQGWSDYVEAGNDGLSVIARGRDGEERVASAVKETLGAVAPDVPVRWVGGLLDRQVSEGARRIVLYGRLVSVAGGVGMFLVIMGLFGVAADGVQRRTREIAIRVSLGSPRISLLATITRESAMTSLAGIGLGVAVLVPLHESIDKLIVPYMRLGTGLGSPWLIAVAVGGILSMGMLATLAGARRALTVHPAEALRSE